MKLIFSLTILLSSWAQAYTLNNNFGGAFKKNKVDVTIAETTTCSGLQPHELEELIEPAVDNFWNDVPTSALRLKSAGFSSVGGDINLDRLCPPTDDDCINNAPGNVIPAVKGIVIACNTLTDNFSNNSSVLAVTVPNNFSGRKITGAVILINDMPGSTFFNLSRSDKISVIAHEIGHAIGLGHAEEKNKEALMYYRTVEMRRKLAQDDIDGVSYLYPVKIDACGLLGGTIDTNIQGPPFWQMGISLAFLILIFEMIRLLKRPKARPAF